MDFNFTEEQQELRQLAGRILGDKSQPGDLRALETSGGDRFDRPLWGSLAEAGILGACLPTENGGAGMDLVALGGVLDEAARVHAAVPLWESLALGALPIARFGSDALRRVWLTKLAAGEVVLTAAWHEDGGEPLQPRLEAEIEGGVGRLTGTKYCVPAGMIADAVVVPAQGPDGPVLALVSLAGDGIERERLVTTLGTPDATLHFDGARGVVFAQGTEALTWCFERAVATQCAVMAGICETALRTTAQYSIDRKQFDTPIATFQAVAHREADAFIDTEAVRLTALQALWRLAEDLPAATEVAIAKFWAATGGQRVVHAAQHVHGGTGVDRDYPVHRCFLAAKQAELHLGGEMASLRRVGALIAAGEA